MAIDYQDFVSRSKSLLIAPAGYGKTHSIVECLKFLDGKQLILTHTHAGVAALKERIKKHGILSKRFQVETITSFSQRYVKAFYCGNDIPNQQEGQTYYPFIVEKATLLIGIKPIANVIKTSFTGLFVDEYQDCSLIQHKLITALSNILKTRLFGDPLQGIFEFNVEPLIDLTSDEEMGDFLANKFELDEPWRWRNGGNVELGNNLSQVRALLEKGEKINLREHTAIELVEIPAANLFAEESRYRKMLLKLIHAGNLLVIHPVSSSIHPRLKLIKYLSNQLQIIESIDDQDFYRISNQLDGMNITNVEKVVGDVAKIIFNKTGVEEWFSDRGLKSKRDVEAQRFEGKLQRHFDVYKKLLKPYSIEAILNLLENLPNIRCYRRELFLSLCYALREASFDDISITEAMINTRNRLRRNGRRIGGKCIGTTLLTKGLEFETVAVLNAHQFDSPKHLYVALSRASKKLVIFTENAVLSPYPIPPLRSRW